MIDIFAHLVPCRHCGHAPYFQREDNLVACFNPDCPGGNEDVSPEQWNKQNEKETA